MASKCLRIYLLARVGGGLEVGRAPTQGEMEIGSKKEPNMPERQSTFSDTLGQARDRC